MSQSGVLSVNVAPAGNVTNVVDNAGTTVTPDALGAIGVVGKNSAFTLAVPASHTLDIKASASYLVGAVGDAPFNTISAAITQAVTDGVSSTAQANIVIKPGVYAESLTVSTAGINFIAWDRQESYVELSPNSTIQKASVRITGTATITASTKFIGIGFTPTTGASIFNLNAGALLNIQSCKLEPFNAPAFLIGAATVNLFLDDTNITTQDTSTTDSLIHSTLHGFINIYATNTYVNLSAASTGIGFNLFAEACSLHTNFDFTGLSTSGYFRLMNCYVNAGTAAPFVNSPGTNVIQVDSYNTTYNISGNSVFVCGNISSYLHFFNSTLFNVNTTSTFTDIVYQNTNIYDAANTRWLSYNTSYTQGSRRILSNTSTVDVRDTLSVGTTATNASTVWGVAATHGWAIGVLPTSSNALRLTGNVTDNTDATVGTTIWNIDPANANTTAYSRPLDAGGGFGIARTAPGAFPYTVVTTDCFVSVDTSVARTIFLPDAALFAGQYFIIKDFTGTASVNNITVTTVSGIKTIDGGITFTIASNYASYSFLYDGTNYEVF